MNDYLLRATAMEGKVRAFAVQTTAIVEELRQRHQTSPTATAALGRTVSAALMMGAMLKGNDKLTIQVKGDGPLGQIMVDANANGEVRGYVDHPEAELPLNAAGKMDVAGIVGTEGFIYVIKDQGLKEAYRGSTPIISGELAEDFTYYFAKSEQTPSCVALGVLVDIDQTVKASGGFIIQLLPGMTDEEITQMELVLGQLKPISTLLDQGATLEEVLTSIVSDVVIWDQMDVIFKCQCSRERVEQTLISLGIGELEAILLEDGNAEVVCQYCNEPYVFEGEQLQELISKIS
ncbi:Hsp33 family molecular chaperone HslO [Paenibacillus psychroresistens]|uniref:33 kDa chaperonin n=1 Tax=Paenibacillus psychroresistens TaxID=1778678 RepID=A0A6B8REC0_9BACL|nr:Hsp33 family molecular chaperone HslO [Paenibacillus psychroresistens]QGQ93706.1 Hsp33 family molecular chaperone HslO [Paenibacillus psychroresistens]